MTDSTLIIFVKNPIPGRVKTRLAKDIGDTKAVQVYQQLLELTREIIRPLKVDVAIWYGDEINNDDLWNGLDKYRQPDGDLGQRMAMAVKRAFETSGRVCIIGSDCPQLSAGLIETAFEALADHDFVIGPAMDGGYYLLAMRTYRPEVFERIDWSTAKVLEQTVSSIERLGATYQLLPVLRDIDDIDDLDALGFIIP